jgi:hypothetical protein
MTTTEEMLEVVFSVGSVLRLYSEDPRLPEVSEFRVSSWI